jgi:ribosome biogenesis GTPase A
MQDIAVYGLRYLEATYPEKLKERYQFESIPEDIAAVFDHIGKFRACFSSGREVDYDKTAEVIVRDIRSEKLGAITFDDPKELIIEE